ncbi:CLC-E [Symbiodinium natans]|uniref:CLC-E protein n=1 Tax=Symbiodinium natans TaxID=878477 RepID=A0A812PM88_9DINO|nr:CLC-E [Symbiodinium natans]
MTMSARKRRVFSGMSALMAGAVFQERSSPTASAMSTSSTSFVQSCHRLRVRSAFPAPSLGRPAPRLGSRTSQSSRTMVRASSPLSSPLFLASAAGLATGTLVVLLNDFVHLVQDFLFELPGLSILAPVISASFVSLLLLARGAKGLSGSSDLAALKASGGAPPKDSGEAPLRALAAGLTLAGGNSLGPEGPSVEIGANVAASLSGYQKNTTDSDRALRQNLLAAGCASGIAAGFNAPVAGLFFALESIQSNCAPDDARAKGPPMQLLAAVLAATVSQLGLGSSPAVDLEFFGWVPTRSLWELPVFMSLGVLCGAAAFALRAARLTAKCAFDGLESAGTPRFIFPVLAAAVVVCVSVYGNVQEVLYKGFSNVNLILKEVDGARQPPLSFAGGSLSHLLALIIAKIFLTAVCQSSGQVGGLFAPALFIGACLGGLVGRGLRDFLWPWALWLPDLSIFKAEGPFVFSVPATYAIVGMAACLGSICNVPLTAVVLLLELAGGKDYGVVLPTVAAVGVAVYVEDLLSRNVPKLISEWSSSSSEQAPQPVQVEEGEPLRLLCQTVEELPPDVRAVMPSMSLEAAQEELERLGPGARLAVFEDLPSLRTPPQLLGLVSLADVEKALRSESS